MIRITLSIGQKEIFAKEIELATQIAKSFSRQFGNVIIMKMPLNSEIVAVNEDVERE